MNFTEYGHSAGKPVVYFHGVPGSPIEASLFDGPAREQGLRVLCFDRFAIDQALVGAPYYQHIARAINEAVQGTPVDFIGFSMGSHVALETRRYLPRQVKNLHLVSAVAPLDQGEFLDGMAGKAVFSLAKHHPTLFQLLSQWQALLAARVPGALFRMLFASAEGQDRVLASRPEFKRFISTMLQACFARGVGGYMRDIDQFLAPWSDDIFDCETRVHLWHGTDDNWSPIGMSGYLAESFRQTSGIERAEGLSHYSCLYDAAPKICLRLSGG
jgi:pimeloyl-ACP methyl ester carboxylesterase